MDNRGLRRDKSPENEDNAVIHIFRKSIQESYACAQQFLNTPGTYTPALFFPGAGYALVHQKRWINADYTAFKTLRTGSVLWMNGISDIPIVDCDFLSPISQL